MAYFKKNRTDGWTNGRTHGLRVKKYLILQRKKQTYRKEVLIDIAMADKRNTVGDSPVVGDSKMAV